MSHNHLGGLSEPSIADIEMTKKTQEALDRLIFTW